LNSGEKEPNHPPDGGADAPRLHLVEGEPAPPGINRRRQRDRRLAPTRGWDSLMGFRQRHRGRRIGERDNIYVDRYTRQDVALILGIFMLNILDAFFTLRWLEMGGGEGNPLMDMLIQTNVQIFLLQKCVVVGLWLVILVIHKNFRIARVGLWTALILYTGILFYHFVLQSVGPPPPMLRESLLIR
jgi:hypothetical protein